MDFLGSNPSDLFNDDYPTEFSWLPSETFLGSEETFQNIAGQLEQSCKFNLDVMRQSSKRYTVILHIFRGYKLSHMGVHIAVLMKVIVE